MAKTTSAVNVAVVGLGWWGPKLLRNFLKNPFFNSAIGCDSNLTQIEACRQEFGIATTASFDDVLADDGIGAVAIATPPDTHYQFGKRALLKGKHVLVEKPPTMTLKELEELVDLARTLNLVYMMDSTFVFSEAVQRLKELMLTDYFGDITMMQFLRYGDNLRQNGIERLENAMLKNGMDAISDLIFHDLAILRYFMGNKTDVVSVNAGYNLWKGLCDTAYVNLKVCDCLVHIGLSWTLPERRRDITIFGREKLVVYNELAGYEKLKAYSFSEKREQAIPLPSSNAEPLEKVVSHFAQCIRGHQAPLTGGEFMLGIMETFESIYKSYERG